MDTYDYYVFRNEDDVISSEEFCALCEKDISSAFNLLACDAILFLCQNGYIGDKNYKRFDKEISSRRMFIGFGAASERLLIYIIGLSFDEFKKHPDFIYFSDDTIKNIKECADKSLKLVRDSQEEVSAISATFAKYSNSAQVRKQLEAPQMSETEFVHPLTGEETRTTKSVPRKGFTSVSRIAKG